MFLSDRKKNERQSTAEQGFVTIGGEKAAAFTDSEYRELPVFSPGGYVWRPEPGQGILVVKTGDDGYSIAGAENGRGPDNMANGEVYIKSKSASVYLKNNGNIIVDGEVCVRGDVDIVGRVEITGGLFLNGNPVV
ncbi:MAG: hypothetical protein IJG63_05870 [Oscillospiraceae bacterium]|nr:hypothetical protein [Oscillospiraceae bacterium]